MINSLSIAEYEYTLILYFVLHVQVLKERNTCGHRVVLGIGVRTKLLIWYSGNILLCNLVV
jgi:hypothetical protein